MPRLNYPEIPDSSAWASAQELARSHPRRMMNNDVQNLTRVKNALARIHEAQARLKLEEQYYIEELLRLAQKGGEGHEGHR